jgi:hypothetical protein
MDLSNLHWGSPVGIGLFFAGAGIFFWGLFNGLAAMTRAKNESLVGDGDED